MRTLSIAFMLASVVQASAQSPSLQWVESVPNVSTPGDIAGVNDAHRAPDGSIFLVGKVNGPRSIVGDIISDSTYVAHYDTTGQCLWSKGPGGVRLALDGGGGVYVVGAFTGSMVFGGITLTATGKDAFVAKYDADGQELWARRMGGALDDGALSVAVDGLGRVHVGGYFRGTGTFGSTTLIATHDSTGFHAAFDASGNLQWAVLAGGFHSFAYGIFLLNTMACDAAGNTYMAGQFSGTATFATTQTTTSDPDRIYLARFDAAGNCSWVQAMGSAYGNTVQDIALDPSGNLFLYGMFRGPSAAFGAINLINAAASYDDIFLACYDTNGSAQWAQLLASNFFNDFATNLDLDDSGHVWVTGDATSTCLIGTSTIDAGNFLAEFDDTGAVLSAQNFLDAGYAAQVCGLSGDHFTYGRFNTAEFVPGSGVNVQASLPGGEEGYLARYECDLSFGWMRRMGVHGMAYEAANSVLTDAAGDVYSTGYFFTTAILCGDTLRAPLSASHIWLNKRDANGNCLWTVHMSCSEPTGVNDRNYPLSLAIDANGDLYCTGRFFGTIDIGSTQLVSAGKQDVFLAKFDGNGNLLWAIREGGGQGDEGTSVEIDADGNILLAGLYAGTATIGGTVLTSQGYGDGFLAKYDASGNSMWARSFGGSGWDSGLGVALDDQGNTYITGRYTTSASFDALTINGTGDSDFYLAKYGPNGDLIWLAGSTGTGWKQANSVVVGGSGQIYVTGLYNGDLTVCTNTLVGDPSNYHAFLSCFNPDGELLWQNDYPSTNSQGYALSARPSGDILVAGSFTGSLSVGSLTITGNGGQDSWVASLNSAGQELWVHGTSGNDFWDLSYAADVASDGQNALLVGGFGNFLFSASDQAGGSLTFAPGDPGSVRFAPNSSDAYVARFSSPENISPPFNPDGCNGTVQVPEQAVTSGMIIAPNPVNGSCTVIAAGSSGSALIEVRDMAGRVVMSAPIRNAGNTTIDAAGLVPGVYTLTILSATERRSALFVKE